MTDRIDPARIYVATTSWVSAVTEEHLKELGGAARKDMKLRGDHPVVLEHPEFWVDASEDPETAALAIAVAERLQGRQSTPTQPASDTPAADPSHGPTREELLEARATNRREGGQGGEKAIGKLLGMSEATVQRWRKRHGLIPWPED